MTAARQMAVYSGTDRLGTIIVTGTGRGACYSARDVRGQKVGTFNTLSAAVAAIPDSQLRPRVRVPRKNKRGDGSG